MQWLTVCNVADLQPHSGVCALIEKTHIAIFWMPGLNEADKMDTQIYATGNFDPIGKANVLSRGLIGDINDQPVVASPLYKQHFNLQTGVCLEDESVKIPVYAIRVENDNVQIDISSIQQDGAAL